MLSFLNPTTISVPGEKLFEKEWLYITLLSEIEMKAKLSFKFNGEIQKQQVLAEAGESQPKIATKKDEIDIEKFSLGEGNMKAKKERLEKLITKLMDDEEYFTKFKKHKPVVKREGIRAINNMDVVMF